MANISFDDDSNAGDTTHDNQEYKMEDLLEEINKLK